MPMGEIQSYHYNSEGFYTFEGESMFLRYEGQEARANKTNLYR